jgi:ribose-phosphate pyrophosphokinase
MLLINDKPVNYFFFPAGEIQVRLPEIETERVILTSLPKSSDDIMLIMLVVNALKQQGITDIDLDLLYLPYARQDRVCSKGEAFSLEVMADILNWLSINVRLYDVHSNTSLDLIHYNSHISVSNIFKRYGILDRYNLENIIFVQPDKGSSEKLFNLCINLNLSNTLLQCDKVRDPSTGHIIRYEVPPFNNYKDIFVIDDICDGGATFLKLGEELKQRGARYMILYVTHGIFSQGLSQLRQYYDEIICHHVFDPLLEKSKELTVLRKIHNVNC